MPGISANPPLSPTVSLPEDSDLDGFSRLFDADWVWRAYGSWFGQPELPPQRLRLRQLSYNPRRRAVVTYAAEWLRGEFVTQEPFAIELARDQPARLFRYPQDPNLPGLIDAASAPAATKLLNTHVFTVPVRRVRVDVVRYRHGGHAVLRHRIGDLRFYVRVMRPDRVARLIAAAELVAQSGFALPRLAGCWTEGGVAWLSEIPGTNVRRLIRKGEGVDPEPILDALAPLWAIPDAGNGRRPFSLRGAYRRARRVFRQVLRDHDGPRQTLRQSTAALDPFVESWQPSGAAHNDFYDDQMIRIPDGRLALVDFEEAGLGDPLLDVGNFLAHMRWSAHFGPDAEARASGAYHRRMREAALERFGWDEHALNLREAVCIFRVCTNPVRHLAPDWPRRLDEGLSLANELVA